MAENKPTCTVCAKTFSNKQNVNQHMRNVHDMEVGLGGRLACPMCDSRVQCYEDLAGHMEEKHGMPMEKEELAFACMEDFKAWKKKVENENRSLYVKQSRTILLNNGKKRTLFQCNRDGSYKSTVGTDRKKKLKSQGSCKIGARCPSFIIVKEGAANVRVTFYKRHVGHSMSLEHLTLSRDDRTQIAAKCKKFTRNKMSERSIRKEKKTPSHRLSQMLKSHKESLAISKSMIVVHPNNAVFEVQASDLKHSYVVTKRDVTCSLKNVCPLTCSLCQICVHMYTCTCVDNLIKGNLCKHIHAVVRLGLTKDPETLTSTHAETTEANELTADILKSNVPLDYCTSSQRQSLISSSEVLIGCFRVNEMSADTIKAAQKDISNLLAKYSNDDLTLKKNNREPANKKIPKQTRLFSTKKEKGESEDKSQTKGQ